MTQWAFFLDCAFDDIYNINVTFSNTAYLIDRSVFDLMYMGANSLEDLCELSPYIDMLVKKLLYELTETEYEKADYADVLSQYNVKILLYKDDKLFVDVVTWNEYYIEYFYYITHELDFGFPVNNVCAFGFGDFYPQFYDFLYEGESQLNYLFAVKPLNYNPNGLPVFTNFGDDNDFEFFDLARNEFVEALKDWLW